MQVYKFRNLIFQFKNQAQKLLNNLPYKLKMFLILKLNLSLRIK